MSHDRYFVDKIAKKLFIFEGKGKITESYQEYTEFLALEKEIKELDLYEQSLEKEDKEEKKTVQNRSLKLSYKEQKEYDELPKKIETLENEISELKNCLSNPECYQKIGLTTLSETLNTKEEKLEPLIERFLEIEEKVQLINQAE